MQELTHRDYGDQHKMESKERVNTPADDTWHYYLDSVGYEGVFHEVWRGIPGGTCGECV